MSDINYSFNITVAKDEFVQNFNATRTASMQSAGFLAVTLNLGTATAAVSTANAQSLGYAMLRSLSTATSSTATVSFGRLVGTTLTETVRLRPGEAAALRLHPGNYGARAAAATHTLLIQILED